MAWIITNKSTHLEFADGNTKYLLPKSDVKLKLVDDKVKVYSDANERECFISRLYGDCCFRLF
jgi:hypothetical protein